MEWVPGRRTGRRSLRCARAARSVAGAAAGVVLALACGGEPEPSPGGDAAATGEAAEPAAEPAAAPGGGSGAAQAAAREIFETRCVTCHGERGAGDGPGSASLDPKPRNFQDPEWQASVTDEHIANIVQYGGAAVGRSPTMPGNPDLTGRPEVVEALVRLVRGFGKE